MAPDCWLSEFCSGRNKSEAPELGPVATSLTGQDELAPAAGSRTLPHHSLPAARNDAGCRRCSLRDDCLPNLTAAHACQPDDLFTPRPWADGMTELLDTLYVQNPRHQPAPGRRRDPRLPSRPRRPPPHPAGPCRPPGPVRRHHHHRRSAPALRRRRPLRHPRRPAHPPTGRRTIDEVLGIEGTAARDYYAALPHLLAAGTITSALSGRTKRPPTDPINCLVSFLYGMLRVAVHGALEQVGLDPHRVSSRASGPANPPSPWTSSASPTPPARPTSPPGNTAATTTNSRHDEISLVPCPTGGHDRPSIQAALGVCVTEMSRSAISE